MLTQEQRIRSMEHKHLHRWTRGYRRISELDLKIPDSLADKEVLGVYFNRDKTRIFVTMDGIWIEEIRRYVRYAEIKSVEVPLENRSIYTTEIMLVQLQDDTEFEFSVLQPPPLKPRTREVWQFWKFLGGVAYRGE